MLRKKKAVNFSDLPKVTEVDSRELAAIIVLLGGISKAMMAEDLGAVGHFCGRIAELVSKYVPDEFEVTDEKDVKFLKNLVEPK